MTERLLQALEEKMMTVLSKYEVSCQQIKDLREAVQRLSLENATLTTALRNEKDIYAKEKEAYVKKVEDFISLLDSINVETPIANAIGMPKPVLVQG